MKPGIEELLKYFKGALDSASDAIGMSTPEGRHWYQNKAFDNLFGDIGQYPPSSIFVDEREGRKVFETIMVGGDWTGNVMMKGRDGNHLSIFLRAYPIKDDSGEVVGLVGIHSDVTQIMEERTVLQLQHDLGVALSGATTLKETLTLIVKTACRIPGMDCGGVYLADPDSGAFNLAYSKGLSTQFIEQISYYDKDSDQAKMINGGKAIFAEYSQLKISRNPVKQKEKIKAIAIIPIFHHGKAIGALNVASHSIRTISLHIRNHLETIAAQVGSAIARVIVEEEKLEQNRELKLLSKKLQQEIEKHKFTWKTLEAEKERFRILTEKSPFGISMIGEDGRYLYLNPKFVEIFGYELKDIPSGKEWFEKAFPEAAYRKQAISIWEKDQKKAGIGEVRPRNFFVVSKDNKKKLIHFRPVTLESKHQLVIYEDITERNRLERKLQEAQKMEALGTLAGGIAHDFNNLLMGIQGRTSLMAIELGSSCPGREHIDAIEEYIRSATTLTKQLLGLARSGKYDINPININVLLQTTAKMFGRTRKDISIHIKTHPSPLVIEADKRQIEQVLLNLLINAWQAMPDGGETYLETSFVTLDAAACRQYDIEPGGYCRISVTDTGTGIDKAAIHRIFDPFFTTKEKGRGTGLGLASAFGIVKNHCGAITVYSEVGKGTTFNIYLPISNKKAYLKKVLDDGLLLGSETILMVDDEKIVLDVGKAMLEKLGYNVIIADSGDNAVSEIDQKGAMIDLVILDMIMPGLDGGKTFDRIHQIRPELPVLLSSGYSINGQAADILTRGCNGFIQKPFNISELSKKVREILGFTQK